MDLSKYTSFEYEDFLNDDDFIEYVIRPNLESTLFWDYLIASYPEKADVIAMAKQFILTYRKQDVFSNEARKALVWDRINHTIHQESKTDKTSLHLSAIIRIAAVMFLVSSFGLYWFTIRDIHVSTDYGEIKTIMLPDHSSVTLNGNSTISYARNWNGKQREVWIDGEGFFKVQHINIDTLHILNNQKFVVHTNALDVEVLGTTFNIKNRRDETKVGLLTGKIKIIYSDDLQQQDLHSLIMKPGDYVERMVDKQAKRKKLIDPKLLTVWINHQLIFKDATLQTITQTLEDDLGYKIVLDPQISNQLKIEGEINVDSVDDLLQILTNTLNIKITKENKNIMIVPRN